MKVKVAIPLGYSYERKQKIAADILSTIISRTLAGFDKNNNAFAKYTKDYAEAKGVGRGDVDLKATGSMLEALKVMYIAKDYIEIGIDGRSKNAGKAEGNILGTYGQATPIPGKQRYFLGITEKDVKEILKNYAPTVEETQQAFVDENVFRVSRALSDSQIQAIKQRQLLDSLGLDSTPF